MAIKKCDDITEEGVVETAEETTTGSGFETQPSTQSGVESQSLAQQAATIGGVATGGSRKGITRLSTSALSAPISRTNQTLHTLNRSSTCLAYVLEFVDALAVFTGLEGKAITGLSAEATLIAHTLLDLGAIVIFFTIVG